MRRALTAVPWMKLSSRSERTLRSSRRRILPVIEFSRSISWRASPRLLTSSMLRSDSVVEPASAVVSATMTFWIFLIRFDSTELRRPISGTVRRKTGAMSQCTVNGVDHHEDDPDQGREQRLTAMAISFSTSERTFWSLPRVSPLRWSSNRE